MPTTPITLQPVGGLPYQVVKGHMVMLARGAWIIDIELAATSIQQNGQPSGKCVVVFGGVPMSGTIDPASSGTFGPTGRVRVVAGGNGWSTFPLAADFHADNGVLSTLVYQATATAVGEVLVDLTPTPLGVDVVVSSQAPAMAVFGDSPWFVDVTGTTFVGPRPVAIPDPSLVIRDWDPIHQKAAFSCNTLLLPNTPLVDPRFNGQPFTAYNVEQVFDADGSIGWAWAAPPSLIGAPPETLIVDDLKAAVLYWTRAAYLRTYRYRLIQYQGDGPGGGPSRMALQAVSPSAGMPDILPIAPWSGVAGVVSMLAPSQEVIVVFENADPTLPRVIGYSLISSDGGALGLPLTTTIDAQTQLDIGPTVPIVNIAGGSDSLVLATPYASLLSALNTLATSLSTAATIANVAAAGTALLSSLGSLPPAPTLKTKAT